MRDLFVLPNARVEAVAIYNWSLETFGRQTARRYPLLIAQAYLDLQTLPDRPGVKRSSELENGFWLYPLEASRRNFPVEDRVGRARHVIAFRYDATQVEIARLLHESMDIPARLR